MRADSTGPALSVRTPSGGGGMPSGLAGASRHGSPVAGATSLEQLLAESALDVSEPRLDPARVADALREHFGVGGTLRRIATEKDDTFLLAPQGGPRRWLVKVSSSYEAPAIVDLQSAAVEHAGARDRTLPVPRLLRTLDGRSGAAVFDGPGPHPRVLRVLSFLDGTPVGSRVATPEQCRSIGRNLARLSLALRDLDHPRSRRLLAWDLQHFARLRPLLDLVEDHALRGCIEREFDVFEGEVEPLLGEVEWQVLHDDLNSFNTLVSGGAAHDVCGIIDFGDVVRTAVPFDLAIAVAGHLRTRRDPWAGGMGVVRGYVAVRPLSAVDLEVVVRAAPVRIALRALLTCYQSAANPQRAEYLNSHGRDDLGLLRACSAPGAGPAPELLRELAHG